MSDHLPSRTESAVLQERKAPSGFEPLKGTYREIGLEPADLQDVLANGKLRCLAVIDGKQCWNERTYQGDSPGWHVFCRAPHQTRRIR